jgi:deoxycytidine triphosphate deaminase
MSIVTAPGLHSLINTWAIDALHECVDGVTVDIHLGCKFQEEERPASWARVVNIAKGEKPAMRELNIEDGQDYFLKEKGFCLAITKERFAMPNDMTAKFYLKSKHARLGLNQSQSIILKPGWSGHLVLEISNLLQWHELVLTAGMPIGQVMFLKHDATDGYAGQYSRQAGFA